MELLRAYTHKSICAIGDGGNDVSMIQAADVGVGIVGKVCSRDIESFLGGGL